MDTIARIGMDTSKNMFQLHGVNDAEEPILRRRLRRPHMISFLERLPPTVIGIEAGGAAHYWARRFTALGHEVKILAPQFVKPYVKRGKNDAADAEALCQAMSRPTMRFVPVKTAEQQAALMLVSIRDRLIRSRTQLSNSIRGFAAEFGLITGRGVSKVAPFVERVAEDESLPEWRDPCSMNSEMNWHNSTHGSRRLMPNSWSDIVAMSYRSVWRRFLASVLSEQRCSLSRHLIPPASSRPGILRPGSG